MRFCQPALSQSVCINARQTRPSANYYKGVLFQKTYKTYKCYNRRKTAFGSKSLANESEL